MVAIVGIGIVDVVDVDEQGMTYRLNNFWDNSQFISREKLDIKFINSGAYNGCLQKSADVTQIPASGPLNCPTTRFCI